MIIFRQLSFYIAFAGIALTLLLIAIISRPQPKLTPIAQPAVNPYTSTIAASGIIEAVDKNIAIGVPQSGLVIEVYVKVGDRIKKGQPLFLIDKRELAALLIVQEANIKVSEASVERLKDQLKRLESVQDIRAVSQEEVKTRSHDVQVANAQLEATKAQLEQTKLLIERLNVRSPIDGVVLQNNIRAGEFVSASSTTSVMLLGNLDHLQVRADIDEQNATFFSPEAPAVAFPKNNTTLKLPLRFERVEPYVIPKTSLTGATDERVDTRVLQVIYAFDKPQDFTVYVGQQVDVFIERVDRQSGQ